MSKVFIGGSRRIAHLAELVRARLDTITRKGLPVIVGDANGADKAVQRYLADRDYANVEVFCSGHVCRNNVGRWPTRPIDTDPHEKGFQFYAAKDRAMAREADFGLMIWDGKSTGTLLNVLRLLRQDKKVAVYSVPDQGFSDLRSYAQWDGFIARYGDALRREAEQKAAIEDRAERRHAQADLLPAVAE